jgi:proteic killer suppression protein
MGRLVMRRLDEIHAAGSLADLKALKGARCHELHGDRRGQLSVDLVHPYRLLFEPAHDPLPLAAEGGLDWERVVVVRILEVTDTHA